MRCWHSIFSLPRHDDGGRFRRPKAVRGQSVGQKTIDGKFFSSGRRVTMLSAVEAHGRGDKAQVPLPQRGVPVLTASWAKLP